MIEQFEAATRKAMAGKRKSKKNPEIMPVNQMERLPLLTLGKITRLLRTVRGLKNSVYVVGGLVTEGQTLRDIDIIVMNPDDIPMLKKALGKHAPRAQFMVQKKAPPAPIVVRLNGKEPTSVDYEPPKKGSKISQYEYAGPE